MKKDWTIKKLSEVCTKITDGSHNPPKGVDSSEFLMLSSKNIFDDSIDYEDPRFLTQKDFVIENKRTNIATRDVLLTIVGTIGRVAVVPEDHHRFTLQRSVAVLRPRKDIIDSRFLMFSLQNLLKELTDEAKGVAQKGIYLNQLNQFEIPAPSLPEQKRIVAILDEAFSAIAKAKGNAEQNLKNAKELFESYLQSVFENKGDDWEEKPLGEIAYVKSGGTPSRGKNEYWEGDIPWYSSGELNDIYTIEPERNINSLAIENSNAKLFPKGSLLIGMYDTAALKMSILDRNATFNQAVAGVKPNNNIDLEFVLHYINFKKQELLSLRRGVRQKNLSLEKIKNITIAFPSLKIQKLIVTQLNSLSSETKKLESIYQQKISDLDELKKTILQKAFNGELNLDSVAV